MSMIHEICITLRYYNIANKKFLTHINTTFKHHINIFLNIILVMWHSQIKC